MDSDVDEPPADRNFTRERRLLRTALAGMTTDQLEDLQTTAHRLQHLPFPKLVEALFTQQAEREDAETASPPSPPREHNFAGGAPGRCESRYLQELFADLADALHTKQTRENLS